MGAFENLQCSNNKSVHNSIYQCRLQRAHTVGDLSYKFQDKQNFVGELIGWIFGHYDLSCVHVPREENQTKVKNLRQSITRFFQHETNGLGNCSFFLSFFFSPPSPYSLTSDHLTQPWKLHHHHLLPSCSPSLSTVLYALYTIMKHTNFEVRKPATKKYHHVCVICHNVLSFYFWSANGSE